MSVAIGFLSPGTCSTHFATSLANLISYDDRTWLGPRPLIDERSGPNVARARNRVVERFLERGEDWLLFIDADMSFEPNTLDALMLVADAEFAPIVGALCFGTSEGRMVATIFDTIELAGEDVIVRVEQYPQDRIVKVAATGCAFLLIHRSVLVAMRFAGFSTAFPWFQETERDGYPCGEDVTFCLRAGELGFPVLVDTRVKTGHHKSVLFTEQLASAQGV